MATTYPTTKQSVPNPTGTDLLDNSNAQLDHDYQHSTVNDTIEALQDKVGIDNDPNVDSFDYKLSDIASGEKAISSNGSGQTLVDITLTDPQINFGGDATGDMYYRNAGGVTTRLPIGTAGDILQVDGTLIPEWVANPSASAATTTTPGIVELATTAETTTGTDATRAVTPQGLHDMTSLAGATWFLDEDDMVSDSATKTVSQQSVKAYVSTFSEGKISQTINADENSNAWFTSCLQMPQGASVAGLWTYSFTKTSYGNGTNASANGGVTMSTTNGFRDFTVGSATDVIAFNDARTFKMKFMAESTTPSGTGGSEISSFIGFGKTAANANGTIGTAADERIGFAFYNGNIYIMSSNGTTVTSTSLGAYTNKINEYVLQVNGTTSADFYIDGTLVGTISTNIPSTSATVKVILGALNAGGGGCGFTHVSDITFSQKTS